MPDAPDKDTAIADAVAEATAEVEGTTAPAPAKESSVDVAEHAAEAKMARDNGVTADKAEPPAADDKDEKPEEEEVFTPTAEELALIDKSPELKKVYRSMQKGLTQKSQRIASELKKHKEEVEIATWIRLNPKEAARTLAASVGLTLTEAEAKVAKAAEKSEEAVDALVEKWNKAVGPEAAAILRGLVEETADKIAEKKVEPFKTQADQLMRDANQRGIAASLREFGAEISEQGGDFSDEVQVEMSNAMDTLDPKEDTTIHDYLAAVHDMAITRINRKSVAKDSLRRLRAARQETEPTGASRPAPKAERSITNSMSDRDAVALAVELAQAEMRK